MDQITFIWTMLAVLFGGFQLFFQKVVAAEGRDSALNGLFMYALPGFFALIVQFLFFDLPDMWMVAGLFGFLGGAVHAIGNYVRIEALKYIDSVIYFPINKVLGPLLVIIGGVLIFKDSLSFQQYIGIFAGLGVPLLLLSAAEHHRQKNLPTGLLYIVVSTTLTSISILLSKHGIDFGSAVFFVMGLSQVGGSISSILLFRKNNPGFSHVFRASRRDVSLGLIAGTLGFCSTMTLLTALSTGVLSIVYSIHAHYILIAIILSVWWYNEHINLRKVLAIILSLLAIGILYGA